MKTRLTAAIVATLLCGIFTLNLRAENSAVIDFGKLTPSKSGGQFVEVNLQSNLISMVARLAERTEPQIAEILRGLQGVRVTVIGLADDNRAQVEERVQALRTKLDQDGWDRIVTVQTGSEDVGVFLKARGAEAIEGLVVTVLQNQKEAVLVNIIGNIRPEDVSLIGERFNIEPLKHLGPFAKK